MLTFKIAFRNLLLHKVKTAVIGIILTFGTTLAVVGNSVVDAISSGMQRSLTDSVTGEIQIFSSDAEEKLSIFGNMDGSMPDVGHVNNFAQVRDTLMAKIPNIKAMIPMGTNFAMWSPGNILDVKLEDLRGLYNSSPRNMVKINQLKEHIRSITTDIQRGLEERKASVAQALAKDETFSKAPETLRKALAPEFWASFDANSEARLEFLSNSVAPLIFDETFVWLSYMGTVPQTFKNTFSQFEIVKGTEIPEGKRGFLFSEYTYETFIKNRVARKLDQVKKRLAHADGSIAKNQLQKDAIAASVAQAAEIYSQIAPHDARELQPKLAKFLGSAAKGEKGKPLTLAELVTEFLKMDDSNFQERYQFFYDEIAPKIVLYKVRVGDVFPVTAFAKSGYSTSVNMKVYGTYRFKSFESSPIAGNFNLMDMMSFRELYGFMTAEKRDETKSLEAEMGVRDIGRDSIDSIFGGAETKTNKGEAADGNLKGALSKSFKKFEDRKRVFEMTYTKEDMENGVFLNAAVKLKDPSKISATMDEIREVAKAEGLKIQAMDWREAAGLTGQLTVMVRAVLFLLMIITFGIATFVIMNSMLMATIERTKEIGTMRAIGAQRKFLMSLFLHETAILAFIFGGLGTAIGLLIIGTIGRRGIPAMGDPAQGDVSTFFFSGDRLFLALDPIHVVVVFVCMTFVAVLSTQYPAWRAMRISPLAAIQSKE